MYTFHFYPTILNEYTRYLRHQDTASFQRLIDRINRTPIYDKELLQKMNKGVSFEDAVCKNIKTDFSPEIVKKAQEYLPRKSKRQVKVSFRRDNIHFYGYADVVGDGRVIDIKTTGRYGKNNIHSQNFQNLYLYALKDAGFKQMEYLIYDFEQLHTEIYPIEQLDFEAYFEKMEGFSTFLLKNLPFITDKKIVRLDNSLPLF